MKNRSLTVRALVAISSLLVASSVLAFGVGQNVNMVTGTKYTQGDTRSTKQNESSIAQSSRNPRTLLAASNDYRLVEMLTAEQQKGAKAWVQLYKSLDGGATWFSTPLGGCPNNLPECIDATGLTASLRALGPDFSADPTVRAGPFGTFFFSFIAGTRSDSADGVVAVQRFVDKNNAVQRNTDVRECSTPGVDGCTAVETSPGVFKNLVLKPAQDPIHPDVVAHIVTGKTGQFVDKPWNGADVPRSWNVGKTCRLLEWTDGLPSGSQAGETVPAFNVYVSFANFPGQGQNQHPSAYVAVSEDCGKTFANPIKLSNSLDASQGTQVAIDPLTGHVYVAWRRFGEVDASPPKPHQIYISKSTDGGKTWSNQPTLVADIRPYDQDATGTSFRTLDFPSLAVSVRNGVSRLHLAWANRGGSANKPAAMPSLTPPYACGTGVEADCDARVVIATSTDGGTTWSAPVNVDSGFAVEYFQPGSSTPQTHSRGHQLQPVLTTVAGKLLATWIDNRLDHTEGLLVCPGGGNTCSIAERVEIRSCEWSSSSQCISSPR